ncbi:DUF190 domain-containing protein [Phenylobacterium sp.]|uniref:DUF190 domain-containing protein n=1 Tax=Phenylobacterium sp. TaxID=1871053 RepID=UPI00392F7F6B
MKAPQSAVLVRIYTEEGKRNGDGPLHEAIVLKARELGLAGATVLRGPMGYGHTHAIHTAKILDLSARLPLVIEIVDTREKVDALLEALGDMRDLGLVTTENVQVVHYGDGDL